MDKERLTYLLNQYIEGRCSEAEKAELIRVLHTPSGGQRVAEHLDRLWDETAARPLPDARAADMVEAILAKGREETPRDSDSPFRWWRAAAVILMVAFVIGLSYRNGWLGSVNAEAVVAQSVDAPGRFIKLPDGSTVVLNAGSRLDYQAFFENGGREVRLEGEGYFDIVHDPLRPFVVHTGEIKTTVLGTAFNVRAYPNQTDITVTVTRGQVKVSDQNQTLGIVNPDEQITLNRAGQSAKQKEVDARSVASWIARDLYFEDLTMAEVVEQLERRFDVRIHLSDSSVQNCRFTATFIRGEDIDQILRVISEFNDATVVSGAPGVYTIEGGHCGL